MFWLKSGSFHSLENPDQRVLAACCVGSPCTLLLWRSLRLLHCLSSHPLFCLPLCNLHCSSLYFAIWGNLSPHMILIICQYYYHHLSLYVTAHDPQYLSLLLLSLLLSLFLLFVLICQRTWSSLGDQRGVREFFFTAYHPRLRRCFGFVFAIHWYFSPHMILIRRPARWWKVSQGKAPGYTQP